MARWVTGITGCAAGLIRGIHGLRNQREELGERVLAFAHDGPQACFPGRLGLEQHYREAASHYYGNLPEYQIDATVKHLFGQPQNMAARPPYQADCLAATAA
jgi:hypothetical protein